MGLRFSSLTTMASSDPSPWGAIAVWLVGVSVRNEDENKRDCITGM
jgi:hypothetical protein